MFEFDRIPSQWYAILQKPDLIIVPNQHNVQIFSDVTPVPVVQCPAGVDVDMFPYRRRKPEANKPFVFLFLGDDNPRKGTGHVARSWAMWNERYPELAENTILIMKMTHWKDDRELVQQTKNSYLDYRVLPLTEADSKKMDMPTLPSLYEYAHCFLWPTMGEGWGLPLCEAMSSGLPAIYTPYAGTLEYADESYAYPVRYGKKDIEMEYPDGRKIDTVQAVDPDIESVVEHMHTIYTDYHDAARKGYIASRVMSGYFTWEHAADRFIEILEQVA